MLSHLALLLTVFAGPAPEEIAMHVENLKRTAVVHAGEAAAGDPGKPLVFAFHGHGGNAKRQARRLAIHEHWPEAVVVYPQGEPGIRGRTDWRGVRSGWQMRPGQADDRDVKFVDALLEEIKHRYSIDPRRVYAVGHSNGGRFAAVLWVMRGETFAAIASACGQGGRLVHRAPPKPVMMIMGESDWIVPIRAQQYSVEAARELLDCDPRKKRRDGYLTLEPGADGLELVTYIHPGGHRWPKEATPHIVEFFKRHRLDETPGE